MVRCEIMRIHGRAEGESNFLYIFPINEYLYPDLCLDTNSLKVFLTRTLNELKYNRIHPGAAFRNFET